MQHFIPICEGLKNYAVNISELPTGYLHHLIDLCNNVVINHPVYSLRVEAQYMKAVIQNQINLRNN